MLEGYAEEHTVNDRDVRGQTPEPGFPGQCKRPVVAAERQRRAAMDVSRELVQQQNQRYQAPVRVRPVVQLARQRALHLLAEALPNRFVRARRRIEPAFLPFRGGPARIVKLAEPEVQQVLYTRLLVQ